MAINEFLTTLELGCQSGGLRRTLGDGVHFIQAVQLADPALACQ